MKIRLKYYRDGQIIRDVSPWTAALLDAYTGAALPDRITAEIEALGGDLEISGDVEIDYPGDVEE